jgi:hypothetical protein
VVVFGWVGCVICVVGLLASVVLSLWPLAPCDEPSAGGSLVGLFLDGTSWGGGGVENMRPLDASFGLC